MDVAELRDLLVELLTPATPIGWKAFFLDALPYVVTIVTLITSTIAQSKASQRETDRLIAQNKHMLDLEELREKEAQKSLLLSKQLEEHQQNNTQRLALYSAIVDALCDLGPCQDGTAACFAIYSNAVKLLGFCRFAPNLVSPVEELIEYMEKHVLASPEQAEMHLSEIRRRIKWIGTFIIEDPLSPSSVQDIAQPDTPGMKAK